MCSFSPGLFPTPLPTATAIPTIAVPTPIATVQPTPVGPSVVCGIVEREGERRCDDDGVRFVFDGGGSRVTDGTGLRYLWTAECSLLVASDPVPVIGVANSDPLQQPADTVVAALVVGEPALEREVRCRITLALTPVNGAVSPASCSTEILVNNCALGCTSTFVQSTLVLMDGGVLAQRKLVTKVVRLLAKEAALSREIRRLVKSAQRAYLEAWKATWSIPSLLRSCQGSL